MEESDPMKEHPLDLDLVAFTDGDLDPAGTAAIGSHVSGCGRCRSLLADLGPRIELGDMSPPRLDLPFDLAQLFAGKATDDPCPGEIWRVEWDGAGFLVLVLGGGPEAFSVAPVTFEGPEDLVATEVPPADAPFEIPIYVWHRLSREVPLGVFLAPFGALPMGYLEAGPTAATFGSSTALLMADISTAVERLADAVTFDLEPAPALAEALPALLKGHATSEIQKATGIALSIITGFKRGDRRATSEEAARLAEYLGVQVSAVSGVIRLPSALIRAVQRPIHRIAMRLSALRAGVSEMAMRILVAERAYALPARTSGADRDVSAWDEIVSQVLDE
jgi:hypothetical protein